MVHANPTIYDYVAYNRWYVTTMRAKHTTQYVNVSITTCSYVPCTQDIVPQVWCACMYDLISREYSMFMAN